MNMNDRKSVRELRKLGWNIQRLADHFMESKNTIVKICNDTTNSKEYNESGSKYDHLFDEAINKGKEYKDYVKKDKF